MTAIQGTLRKDSATGWAMLLSQLQRTLDLVASVHEARGERLQAERLVAISTGELDSVHKRFAEGSIEPLAQSKTAQKPTFDLAKHEEELAEGRALARARDAGRDFER